MTRHRLTTTVTSVVTATILVGTPAVARAQSIETCPETSPSSGWTGTTLNTGTAKNGVVFDAASGGRLALQPAGGTFSATNLGIADLSVYAAVADFDNDGWQDFVGAGETDSMVRIYENRTYLNPAPDWTNPSAVRTPNFVNVRNLVNAGVTVARRKPTAAGDFNGDGWADVFIADAAPETRPTSVNLWLNQASNDASGAPRFLSPYNPMSSPSTAATIGYQNWSGTSTAVYDWNGDRKLDLLISSSENNGEIRVFTNQCNLMSPQPTPVPAAPLPLRCSNNPTFRHTATLITNLGFGTNVSGALPVFAYADFVGGDGRPDLIVGAPTCCGTASQRLRLFKGMTGNTLDTTPANVQSISFAGSATGILAGDFSLDGKLDLMVLTDNWTYNAGNGGIARYWVNNGTATPFSGGFTQLTDILDYDVSFVFDYDHDPQSTPDVMGADGNHTSSFYVLANRVVNQYVPCGEVASGIIDLGGLASSEMVVTAARIHPTVALNGNGTVTFYLSNEEPANWVVATACGGGDYCATFPKSSGREVRWKAVMCSGNNRTTSPTISNMTATFQYTEATEHYRAGTVVNDGIAYLGAFRQPGDRGKFYAINAGLSQTYWEGSQRLDSTMTDAQRNLFTAHKDTHELLAFTTANATNVGLQATLFAANSTDASNIVSWVRSARFGVGNLGIPLSKLGAIETSTAAILTKPTLPTWYLFAPPEQRTRVDQFLAAQANRVNLVLFGSKDGMVHALYTLPTDIGNAKNGKEAWGYIPPVVAAGLGADRANSLDGTMDNTTYPDGSVTLADIYDEDGTMLTLAIIASGNGGESLAAFDVTQTVNPSNGAVVGPTPLWSATPGGANAGRAYSKAAIGRVKIGTETRFIVVAGTGMDFDDQTPPFEKGRIVAAYDAITGEHLWDFQTKCPLTSDISMFETDDDLEPNNPAIDGYMDRAVFSDSCGYVYKVNPARDLNGGWNANAGYGSIAVDVVSGQQLYALFSTDLTDDALGEDSPIAGTIGVQVDGDSARLVLFFGTGGLESHPVNRLNEFYAVFADTGEIRTKSTGTCSGGRCEKFYGGVVVSRDQVLFTRTVDPLIGTGTCDRGSSTIEAVQLSGLEDGEFIVDFEVSAPAATMSALYGDAGAVYFSTLGGDVVRVGQPRAADAGGDTTAGTGNDPLEEGEGSTNVNSPMSLMGWKQNY